MKAYNTNITKIGSAQLLGVFRLLLAILLSIFYLADKRLWPLDQELSMQFQVFIAIYLVFLLATTLVWRKPAYQTNLSIILFAVIDLVLLSILCFYTGRIGSPLLFLILVSIMVHGAMLSLTYGLLLVAGSVIIMLSFWFDATYFKASSMSVLLRDQHFLRIIIQSSIAIVAIFLAHGLGKRVRQSEALVFLQQRTLIEVAALHEAIVQQAQTGIIVVDRVQNIQLINTIAQKFFASNYHSSTESLPIKKLSEDLDRKLNQWLIMGIKDGIPIIIEGKSLHITFSEIRANESFNIVIGLENEEDINQRAQQNKLAALGELTAGIAHEIRNPLTSISQASQLLEEQMHLENRSTKLPAIINKNVARANRIINDILDIARRNPSRLVLFEIKRWLTALIEDFTNSNPYIKDRINLSIAEDIKYVAFDPSQLRQIVFNLLNNALIHGKRVDIPIKIWISVNANLSYSWLTIQDNGLGISEKTLEHLFEPFFSTHHQGTGLGLYLTREICVANQAKIDYIPNKQGAAFRITFAPFNTLAGNIEKEIPFD